MKPNKFALILVAAALLPAFARASTDAVATSLKHGLSCEAALSTVVITQKIAGKKADPIEDEVNASVDSTADPVLASYYRDLYRAPTSLYESEQFARAPDPYMDAISIALWGKTERGTTQIC
ncbi:MAG TPA: hypothetical protein VEP71_05070 [Gallionella sp.]|nr:hypothetical protein [Gallionella sp.]